LNSNSSFIVIPSELSNIKTVFDWLEDGLFKLINNKEKTNTLSLVIQEALVNAIVHGNKEDKDKHVTFSYELNKENIALEVKDEGKGIPKINQKKDRDNMNSEDLLKDSGRGIILIKHFCKEVIFKKNSLQLVVEL
jgi:serine/threonine-protein kinase RsbW